MSEPAGTSWDEVVTAALLGTERRSVEVASLPGEVGRLAARLPAPDAAGAPARLLAVAALATAYRRAGQRPLPAPSPRPEPAAAEDAPGLPATAAARVEQALDRGDTDVLVEWLEAVAAAGRSLPAETLPGLLDFAVRHRSAAPAVAAAMGRRGAWLAGFRTDWSDAVTGAAPDLVDADAWVTGETRARRAWMAATRRRDPALARSVLAESLPRERAEERAAFLAMLADGLAPDDEPLLEAALDDRATSVRAAAADLLARLPGSAFATRMAGRAAACVSLERRALRTRIVVTPPEYDQGLARDGVRRASSERGLGERAWWLRAVIAAAPLDTWVPALAPTAAKVVALPVADDWGDVLRAGWVGAAVRQKAPDWAAALLPHADERSTPGLLALLPERDRALAVATRVHRGGIGSTAAVVPVLAAGTGVWPPAVAEAVLVLLDRLAGAATGPWSHREVLGLAARRLPHDAGPAVARLAARHEDTPWPGALRTVAETVGFRRHLFEELP